MVLLLEVQCINIITFRVIDIICLRCVGVIVVVVVTAAGAALNACCVLLARLV